MQNRILLSIKTRADFLLISSGGTKFHSPTIILLAKKTSEKYLASPKNGQITDFCRVGYTVTKAIGSAVIRNKIKRRFRESFRLLQNNHAKNHFDYVVIAKREAAKADYKKICNDLKFCFNGINKLLENGKSK